MNSAAHPTLFDAGHARAIELRDDDGARLQRFFVASPEYFFCVNGEGPRADEARDALHAELPAGWPYRWQKTIGFVDEADDLLAMANVVADLLADGVWHIGLFIVATRLHGGGTARALYAALERWCEGLGARWLRLGVVAGNARAERFWSRCGFVDVRLRRGIEMGTRTNDVRVMVKPLRGEPLAVYLARVPRDDPAA